MKYRENEFLYDLLYSGTSDETTTIDPWDEIDARLESLKRQRAECPAWDTESAELLTAQIEAFCAQHGLEVN